MTERSPQSSRRKFWIFGIIGLFCAGLLWFIQAYFFAFPAQLLKDMAAADQRFARVRSLYPNPTPRSASEQTTNPLQARCDRLYLDIFNASGEFLTPDLNVLIKKIPAARELAGFYDTGFRVSPEAKLHYRLANILSTYELVNGIVLDVNETSHAQALCQTWTVGEKFRYSPYDRLIDIQNFIKALKFMRVIDCHPPSPIDNMLYRCVAFDSNSSDSLPEIPPELMKLDLDLIEPRHPPDRRDQIRLWLDFRYDGRKQAERAYIEPMFHYTLIKRELAIRGDEPDVFNFIGAIFYARSKRNEENIRWHIQNNDRFLEGAEAELKSPQLPPAVDWFRWSNRPIAAGFELRRGTPLPRPEQIGPDSYFYDPTMQAPYKLYADRSTPHVTKLHFLKIRREDQTLKEEEAWIIVVPANHPGLERVPDLQAGLK